MTPPDKSGSTGQNSERESDRTSSIATDGQDTPVEQVADAEHDGTPTSSPDGAAEGSHEGNHHDDNHQGRHERNGQSTDESTARVATPEDLELSHGTPPPWQRVTSDNAMAVGESSARPSSLPGAPPAVPAKSPDHGQPTTPVTPPQQPVTPPQGESVPPNPPPHGERTVSIERPVVTGTAASRLFTDGQPPAATTPAPGAGIPHAGMTPSRTTVHLEGSGAAPGTSAGPSTGPVRVGAAAPPSALRRPGRGPRRANLQIKRFDPWSVLKLSLVLGVALFFVWLVAVGVLYAVLDGMGVWDKVNGISSEILQPTDEPGGEPLISAGRVFGVAAIIGAVNIVLFSALATVGAFVYNVSADLAGGLEVTLAERE